jgi:hypothetical protein
VGEDIRWIVGASAHYMEFNMNWTGEPTEDNVTYIGPELLLGAEVRFGGGLSGRVMGSYLPMLFWNEDYTDMHGQSASGGDVTTGYSVDARLGYQYQALGVAAGYRLQQTQEDDSDDTIIFIAEDRFGGFYGSVTCTF